MRILSLLLPVSLLGALALAAPDGKAAGSEQGPVRILFLGHDQEHHNSYEYFPMLAEAFGREAIYFDYHTEVGEALDHYAFLSRFDGLLLYANHGKINEAQFTNLSRFVEEGGGFIPVHSASACFGNDPRFVKLVGGRFRCHKTGEFTASIVMPDHPAMQGVTEFNCWDETYVHSDHGDDRTILMVRKPEGDDNITEPEPWTWTREQGKGRVFYTASGHDQRTWSRSEFHQLLKSGILWAIGDKRRATYEDFLAKRAPLRYEKRDNIPNYEKRPEPLPYQFPLSPEDSLSYTHVPIGWKLELFASEPDIINPVYIQWDERGRLWAIETIDYPNEVKRPERGDDSLKILEDTDGDGRCDKVTVFADGLNLPTSFTFANGGVLMHQAPHTLFLQDTDGDDKADVKEVVLDGWGTRDTHAGPSNLRYGLDNRIWGTVGYAAFDAETDGEKQRFGMGVYRFEKDGSSIEFLHQFNNNTWGLGFDEAGEAFGSTANNNPSFYGGIPATIYPERPGLTAEMIASTPKFHPITPNIRQVDAFGAYTSAAGHALANSDAFPESWRGRMAFISGPTGNLLGKFMTEKQGAGYVSKNRHYLLASADEWFSPIAAEVGPDGHLWVIDWYNFIIQHNPTPKPERGGYQAETGKGNAHINPNRDRQHGRIYRMIWEKAPQPRIRSLRDAEAADLVAALSDPNQFWRMTAQRLLVDGRMTDTGPALKELVGQTGIGATHALWCLHGLGILDADTHRSALLSTDPVLRRNAIRALSLDTAGATLLFESAVINDPDLTTRLAAFVVLAGLPASDSVKVAIKGLLGDPDNAADRWLSAALEAAAGNHQLPLAADGGEFEPGPDLLAGAGWQPHHYSGEAAHRKQDRKGYQNGPWFEVSSTKGADASFLTKVDVKPGARYRLSGHIRTTDIKGAMGALLNVHQLQDHNKRVATKAISGTKDWTEVGTDFSVGGRKQITINALFGGWGRSTGTAGYSGIQLHELIPVPANERAEKLLTGRVGHGKTIFHTHQVAACNRCHQVGGEGGVIGPALDGIATKKNAVYLRESLLEPNKAIAESYPGPVSPMPPMNLLLSPQEIEDLLAYLQTLK